MARIKTIYKIMVNVWNGSNGIASDDYNEEYDGVEYTSEAEAKRILKKAWIKTKRGGAYKGMNVKDLLSLFESEFIKRCIFVYDGNPETSSYAYDISDVLNSADFTEDRLAKIKKWSISPGMYETFIEIYI